MSKKIKTSRRQALNLLAISGISTMFLPKRWTRPVINSVLLPAHAQTSMDPPQGSTNFSLTGTIEDFTVPDLVTSVTIEARGAQGGRSGGLGAEMIGDFDVAPGDVLRVLVGGQGQPGENDVGSGGGGGSFVATSGNVALIVAGGGGGTGHSDANANYSGINATTSNDGQAGQGTSGGAGGTAGNGGDSGSTSTPIENNAAGGGGFLTDGGGTGPVDGGDAYVNGGAGGISTGGFGGGGGGTGNTFACGSGNLGGSGGGGYSGGGGGNFNCNGAGGGGGSFNSGTNQTNAAGVQSGDGNVTISWG